MDGQRKTISLEEIRHRLSRALFLLFGIEQRDGNAEWIHSEQRSEILCVLGDRQPANHDVVESRLVTVKEGTEITVHAPEKFKYFPKPACSYLQPRSQN